MKGYGNVELGVARSLGRFPRLKAVLKSSYTRLNFAIYGESSFSFALADGVFMADSFAVPRVSSPRFFGYFDVSPWSPRFSSALLQHGSRRDGKVDLIVVDEPQVADREYVIGQSDAFSQQQGTRLQWVPDPAGEMIVWNGTLKDSLGSFWMRWDDKSERIFLPWPVHAVAPDGQQFLSLNYPRLSRLAPDYGYAVEVANFDVDTSSCSDGLWLFDRSTDTECLVVSFDRVLSLMPESDMLDVEHELNHASFSPDGRRVAIIHRWSGKLGRRSRLLELDLVKNQLRVLLGDGMVSHYTWLPDGGLVVFGRRDGTDAYQVIAPDGRLGAPLAPGRLDAWGDGHPSVSSCGRFLLTDSYPDRRRQQHLLVCDLDSGQVTELGCFLSPLEFQGVNRVDLHPRWHPDGDRVCIDSSHEGERGVYVLDVAERLASRAGWI